MPTFEVGVEPSVRYGCYNAGVGGFAASFEVDVHVGAGDGDWFVGEEYHCGEIAG